VTCFADTLEVTEGPDADARVKMFGPVLKEYAKQLGETEINGKVLRAAWDRLVPGMLGKFDAPSLLPQIAPRPLLIISHENDELFPLAGAKKTHEAAKLRYRDLKAEEKLDFRVMPGLKHAGFNLMALTGMMDWMDRWLKTKQ
jgi:hypothetical protein